METKTETALTPFIGQHVWIVREHGDRLATFTGTVRSSFMLDDDALGHETGFSDQGVVSIVPTLMEVDTSKSWEGTYTRFEAADGRSVTVWQGDREGSASLVWVDGDYAGSFDLSPAEAARAALEVDA